MVIIETNNVVNAVLVLTLLEQSGKVHHKKSLLQERCSGKESIMAMNNVLNRDTKSVMGSYFYFYFKACYFAGLFRRAAKPLLSCA